MYKLSETIGNYRQLSQTIGKLSVIVANCRKLSELLIEQIVGYDDYDPILHSYWNYQTGIITTGEDMYFLK